MSELERDSVLERDVCIREFCTGEMSVLKREMSVLERNACFREREREREMFTLDKYFIRVRKKMFAWQSVQRSI